MGTHPIFESDFDCLTDIVLNSKMLEESEEDRNLLEKNSGQDRKPDKILLLKCFLAVLFCYLLYGICHEAIFKQSYDGSHFSFTLWLMAVQAIFNSAMAFIREKIGSSEKDPTPLKFYVLSAIFFCGAIFGSNEALKYLSYPSQVVGKASKPIPVLLMSVIVGRKRFNFSKYGCVLLLVIGVTLFLYKPAKEETSKEGVGYVLLLMSLLFDGLCGGMQEKIRSSFSPSPSKMMLWTNFCSFMILFPALIFTSEGITALIFIQKHPRIIPRLCAFFICSAFGQFAIFTTIKHFGPLTVSIFTTCRKFFTVLCSVLIFGNILTIQQWVGAVIVFTGLFLDTYFGDF